MGYSSRNSYAFFRKVFCGAGEAVVEIAADSRYELHLDGRRVERGTSPSPSAYTNFDTHRLTLEPGEHVLGVLVHHIGEECATAQKSRPGLLVDLTLQDGTKIGSDSSWKVLPGTAFKQELSGMMSHFGFYEVCDCRDMPEDWADLAFDDSSWHSAEVVASLGQEPWLRLVPRDIPLLSTTIINARAISVGEYIAGDSEAEFTIAAKMAGGDRRVRSGADVSFSVRLGTDKNEFLVADFGREVTGHVRLIISGAADGQVLDIGYDETLDECGLPNPKRTAVEFADSFILREGQRTLEVFDARGFRYLLLDVPAGNGGLVIEGVEIDERTYPVTTRGSFRCSDERLNRLYEIGLETTRLCMLDTYVDCPSRERVLWMDSYLEGLCSSYGMGITDLWRRVLYMFAQDVVPDGPLKGAVKSFVPTDRVAVLQSYVMYYVCSVADFVLHSGEIEVGRDLLETVKEQFRVLEQFETPEGLFGEEWPSWNGFYDWSAMDYGGVSASGNAIYLVMLRKGARLAEFLGGSEFAEALMRKHEKLLAEYKKLFWSSEENLFIDAVNAGIPSEARSQLSNVLAIWAGVVGRDDARAIIERITDTKSLLPVTPGDYRLRPDFKCHTGGIVPIGTPALGTFLALVIFELGMDHEALSYINEAWSPIAENGTFAEHYCEDANTSFCHGWSAGPVMLLPRYVLGVRPTAPGWTKVKITPHPGDLEWAEGSVLTPLGELKVSWKRIGGKIELDVSAPEGMAVE